MIDIDEYKEVLEALESGFIEIIDVEQHRKATCEALEKQIPKKVKIQFREMGGVITCFETDVCPTCGDDFYIDDLGQTMYYSFCPGCGQALDWSGEDE